MTFCPLPPLHLDDDGSPTAVFRPKPATARTLSLSAAPTAAIPLRAAADDDDDDLALLDGHLPSDAGRFETSGITTAAMAPAAASLPALIPAPASEPGVGDLPARYQ